MRYKYAPTAGKQPGTPGGGRYVDPSCWKTGPDPALRDKYYAYLRHRSQARFRKEHYSLTWEDWQSLWPDSLWNKRSRAGTGMCLARLNWHDGWHMHNVQVMTRREHFKIRTAHGV